MRVGDVRDTLVQRLDPQAVELTTGGLALHEPDRLLDGVWPSRIPVEDHVLGRG